MAAARQCLFSAFIAMQLGAATVMAAPLSITTFNIRFYGLDGDADNALGSETRDATIRAHLERESALSDVLVLQEIVDVEGLEQRVLGGRYACETYGSRAAKHQYVVVCVKPPLTFVKAADDDDYALGDVDLGVDSYRPAVHGLVTAPSGLPLAHIIAVHLKAQPDAASRAKRLKQIGLIRDYIARRADAVPLLVIGDANTHGDDAAAMDRILGAAACGLRQVPVDGDYTWRTPTRGNKLDRIWAAPTLQVIRAPHVAGPCNERDVATIRAYNARVSDHCPLTLAVEPVPRDD